MNSFRTLIENITSEDLKEKVKKDFIIPMSERLQARFSKINNNDLNEIESMKDKFMLCIDFYLSMSGMSIFPIKQVINNKFPSITKDNLLKLIKDIKLDKLCK